MCGQGGGGGWEEEAGEAGSPRVSITFPQVIADGGIGGCDQERGWSLYPWKYEGAPMKKKGKLEAQK